MALVRARPQPMQGMEGWGFNLPSLGKILAAPFVAPTLLAIEGAKLVGGAVGGSVKGIVTSTKDLVGGVAGVLRPPPPPPPAVADYYGVGGALTPAALASSSSKLPLILGGVALVGLVTVALVMRSKKKGRRRR